MAKLEKDDGTVIEISEIKEPFLTHDRYGQPMFVGPVEGGVLAVTWQNNSDVYKEMWVDFIRDDGKDGQVAVIGTTKDDETDNFHVYTWDGDNPGGPDHEHKFNPHGVGICY